MRYVQKETHTRFSFPHPALEWSRRMRPAFRASHRRFRDDETQRGHISRGDSQNAAPFRQDPTHPGAFPRPNSKHRSTSSMH
jgi:hypothetical protein